MKDVQEGIFGAIEKPADGADPPDDLTILVVRLVKNRICGLVDFAILRRFASRRSGKRMSPKSNWPLQSEEANWFRWNNSIKLP